MAEATTRGRQVPAFRVDYVRPRAFRHALVIPVLNEGERIRAQLRRIAAAAPRVDVVMADGGSTDGSLAADFVSEVGVVRAVLVKQGPGRLSAQLRMAYAWCLDEGYDGIVTMDGNGKDGVEAIDAFVDALEKGYDLVQGSRYIAGGEAVNTPLDRHIGNRFVHAPVISLASGFHFTDTTNGFRAYSRRYLEHPAVQPFRDVFSDYSLLFYLSVRAPGLGLKCVEIPVRRVYPDTGKTPTKVAGLRGRFAMLGELFAAALGRFNP